MNIGPDVKDGAPDDAYSQTRNCGITLIIQGSGGITLYEPLLFLLEVHRSSNRQNLRMHAGRVLNLLNSRVFFSGEEVSKKYRPKHERNARGSRKGGSTPRYLPQPPNWLFPVVSNPMCMCRDASVLPQR